MRFAYEITLNHEFSICQNWKLRIVLSEIGRKINENATCSIYKTYSCGAIEIKYSYTTNLLEITKKNQFEYVHGSFYHHSIIPNNKKHVVSYNRDIILYKYANKKDFERFLQSFLVLIRYKPTYQCILSKSLQLQWKECAKETSEFLESVKTQWVNSRN